MNLLTNQTKNNHSFTHSNIFGYIIIIFFALSPVIIIPNQIPILFNLHYSFQQLSELLLFPITLLAGYLVIIQKHEKLKFNLISLSFLGLIIFDIISLSPNTNMMLFWRFTSMHLCFYIIHSWALNYSFNLNLFTKVMSCGNWIIILGALSGIFFRLNPFFIGGDFLGSTLGYRNNVSIFLISVLPILCYGIHSFKHKCWYFLLSLQMTLSIYIAIILRTRSSWIMIIAQTLIITFHFLWTKKQSSKKGLITYYSVIVIAIILVVILPHKLNYTDTDKNPFLKSAATLLSFDESHGRKEIWKVSAKMIKNNLFTGVGAGNFSNHFFNYLTSSGVPRVVFASDTIESAFNDYVEWTVEIGILGGVLFWWIFMGATLYILVRRWKSFTTPEIYMFMLVISLSVCGLVDSPFRKLPTSGIMIIFLSIIGNNINLTFKIEKSKLLIKRIIKITICISMILITNPLVIGIYKGYLDLKFQSTNNIEYVINAQLIEPDDYNINSFLNNYYFDNNQSLSFKYAKMFVNSRPYDLNSHATLANQYKTRGDLKSSLKHYLKSFSYTGLCNTEVLADYIELIQKPLFGNYLKPLEIKELGTCRDEYNFRIYGDY